MDAEHHRRLERMYQAAPCNQYFKPRIKIGDGVAEVALDVRPDLLHAARALHGSVYFKVLDDATYFAANSRVPGFFVVTADFDLHLVRPVSSGTITARGKLVYESEKRFLADAEITDQAGTVIGRGTGNFIKTNMPLLPANGYR